MKRRRHIGNLVGMEIPLTPVIDIVFLLLIYFMLASNFIQEQQFIINLPKSGHGSIKARCPLIVHVSKTGQLTVAGKKIDGKELLPLLESMSRKAKNRGVEVRAHRETPVQLIIEIMDTARLAGVERVRITTLYQGRSGP